MLPAQHGEETGQDYAYVTGPFFLGFCFESFGMGIVLVLSLNYFIAVYTSHRAPADSPRRWGVLLITVSMTFNLAQTLVDLSRGWNLFGTNFDNPSALSVSTPLFFVSPFLGLFPSAITQVFLLRRSTLFLSSLGHLWPKLASPVVKWAFVVFTFAVIGVSFVAGSIGSVWVYTSGSLWALHAGRNSSFSVVGTIWLSTSTAVDFCLSLVLCAELWWARRKLSMDGGVMKEIVTRLILVTCNGGLAVTGLQLTSLLLYNDIDLKGSMCYFPITVLPKVYNITLILSISLPLESRYSHSPVLTLPTMLGVPPETSATPSPTRPNASPCPSVSGIEPGCGSIPKLRGRKRQRTMTPAADPQTECAITNEKRPLSNSSALFFERGNARLFSFKEDLEQGRGRGIGKGRGESWPNQQTGNDRRREIRQYFEPNSIAPLIPRHSSQRTPRPPAPTSSSPPPASSTGTPPRPTTEFVPQVGRVNSKYYIPKDHALNHPVFVFMPPPRKEQRVKQPQAMVPAVGKDGRRSLLEGRWGRWRGDNTRTSEDKEEGEKVKDDTASLVVESPMRYSGEDTNPFALLPAPEGDVPTPTPERDTTMSSTAESLWGNGSGDALLFRATPMGESRGLVPLNVEMKAEEDSGSEGSPCLSAESLCTPPRPLPHLPPPPPIPSSSPVHLPRPRSPRPESPPTKSFTLYEILADPHGLARSTSLSSTCHSRGSGESGEEMYRSQMPHL